MAAGLQLDSLYCQEDTLWVSAEYDAHQPPLPPPPPPAVDDEEEWSALLSSLAAKERETHPHIPDGWRPDNTAAAGDPYLRHARQGAVEWVCRACARLGFSALTALLAVSYLDRCFLPGGGGGGLTLQADRPWMERLSAVACLSLAAKVEETYVPLLLDLQAVGDEVVAASGGGGYVFEPKTVRRMELLVLSALGWRMNPVTPLSFIHHLLPKLATTGGGDQLLRSCHTILLSMIADWRWILYSPSVWAGAALLHATGQSLESGNNDESTLALLGLTKEIVEGAYQLVSDTIAGDGISISNNKRNSYYYQYSYPPSPDGVIGGTECFSYDSASSTIGGECWSTTIATTMWPVSVSSSPEQRPFKRPNCGG